MEIPLSNAVETALGFGVYDNISSLMFIGIFLFIYRPRGNGLDQYMFEEESSDDGDREEILLEEIKRADFSLQGRTWTSDSALPKRPNVRNTTRIETPLLSSSNLYSQNS